jgi:cobalt-precorrin 5A hydrolase
MKTAIISLTKNGANLSASLGQKLGADIFIKEKFIDTLKVDETDCPIMPVEDDFSAFVGRLFAQYDGFVFIMACGIVVRTIAPFIKNKTVDPAVVVTDEFGKHVISLLSGHMGGANELAVQVAQLTRGTPVITTSTDVNNTVAFDVFAEKNNCCIENIKDLKFISSELVNGGKVALYSGFKLKGHIPENVVTVEAESDTGLQYAVIISNHVDNVPSYRKVLYIRPKNLIMGFGCRRGVSKGQIESAVSDFLEMNSVSPKSLKAMATIDLKKDEKGLQEFCSEKGLELRIVNRDDIKKVEDGYTASNFVKEHVGVSSVAEPCSVLAGNNARLICGKTVYQGITLALSEEEMEFYL